LLTDEFKKAYSFFISFSLYDCIIAHGRVWVKYAVQVCEMVIC